MWNPFNDFPREYGLPARVSLIYSMLELIKIINLYNTKTTIFTSLYGFDQINEKKTRGIYSSARVRQIYYDIDEPETLDSTRTIHKYCMGHNLLHCMNFSGGGVHIYISSKYPNNLKNKKGAVTNAQIHIADKLGLSIGINGGVDIDGHIIGNVAQLVRPPGTYNLKRKLYCIPLKKSDLNLSLKEVKGLAKKQRFGIYVYGEKYFDLAPFDSEPVTRNYEISLVDYQKGIGIDKVNIETFPPCIKVLTTKRFLSHRERYIFILYCRELGLPIADTVALLQKFLDPKTLYHCLRQERQPLWIYRRTDLVFPSCEKLKSDGLCPGPNCQGANLYD